MCWWEFTWAWPAQPPAPQHTCNSFKQSRAALQRLVPFLQYSPDRPFTNCGTDGTANLPNVWNSGLYSAWLNPIFFVLHVCDLLESSVHVQHWILQPARDFIQLRQLPSPATLPHYTCRSAWTHIAPSGEINFYWFLFSMYWFWVPNYVKYDIVIIFPQVENVQPLATIRTEFCQCL